MPAKVHVLFIVIGLIKNRFILFSITVVIITYVRRDFTNGILSYSYVKHTRLLS